MLRSVVCVALMIVGVSSPFGATARSQGESSQEDPSQESPSQEVPKKAEPKPASARTAELLVSLKDTQGKTHDLAKLGDKIVVLQWVEPDCPWCVKTVTEGKIARLINKYGKNNVVFLGISSSKKSDAKALERFRRENSVRYPILVDATQGVGKTYGARTTPHVFILNRGKVVYQGAVDDLKTTKKGINYVDRALEEITSGKKVTTPRTEPYGCPIRYAKKKSAGE